MKLAPLLTFVTLLVEAANFEDDLDLRIDPLEEGGSDGGSSRRVRIGHLTRSTTKRMEE